MEFIFSNPPNVTLIMEKQKQAEDSHEEQSL